MSLAVNRHMTQHPPSIDFFSSVNDPRVLRTQKHSLDSILFISLCAVICGADGWNEIEDYGNAKINWLKKFLHLPNGISSHDTFNRVISMLDPKELNDSFVAWTKSIAELTDREVVAIDAMGCQREIAKTVIGRGADYILALKGNQPEMLDRVSGSFRLLSLHQSMSWRVNLTAGTRPVYVR